MEDMAIAWTVIVGNISIKTRHRKTLKEFVRILKEDCEGFLGVNPCPPYGTILFFKTLNDAKISRNVLESKGIKCSREICDVHIPAEYVQEQE